METSRLIRKLAADAGSGIVKVEGHVTSAYEHYEMVIEDSRRQFSHLFLQVL